MNNTRSPQGGKGIDYESPGGEKDDSGDNHAIHSKVAKKQGQRSSVENEDVTLTRPQRLRSDGE